MNFDLIGHDCPSGVYPSPVVPIGEFGGELFAAFRDSEQASLVRLPKDFIFVRYGLEQLKALRALFDVDKSELFALSERTVRCYLGNDSLIFLREILGEETASELTHEFRVIANVRLEREDVALRELKAAAINTFQKCSPILNAWYDNLLNMAYSAGARPGLFPLSATNLIGLDLVSPRLAPPTDFRDGNFEKRAASLAALSELQSHAIENSPRHFSQRLGLRTRVYALTYWFPNLTRDSGDHVLRDAVKFVRLQASSYGRQLIEFHERFGRRTNSNVELFTIFLQVACPTTGEATAEKLSRAIASRYPSVEIKFARRR